MGGVSATPKTSRSDHTLVENKLASSKTFTAPTELDGLKSRFDHREHIGHTGGGGGTEGWCCCEARGGSSGKKKLLLPNDAADREPATPLQWRLASRDKAVAKGKAAKAAEADIQNLVFMNTMERLELSMSCEAALYEEELQLRYQDEKQELDRMAPGQELDEATIEWTEKVAHLQMIQGMDESQQKSAALVEIAKVQGSQRTSILEVASALEKRGYAPPPPSKPTLHECIKKDTEDLLLRFRQEKEQLHRMRPGPELSAATTRVTAKFREMIAIQNMADDDEKQAALVALRRQEAPSAPTSAPTTPRGSAPTTPRG